MKPDLEAFYRDAQLSLAKLAEQYGLFLPQGHACIEASALHWRLTAYAETPEQHWEGLWRQHAQALGLGTAIEPGDVVIDQEGRTWTLLGLDPSASNFPVRLKPVAGPDALASLEAAGMFQLLVKRDKPEVAAEVSV
jgi:hypothetical protein